MQCKNGSDQRRWLLVGTSLSPVPLRLIAVTPRLWSNCRLGIFWSRGSRAVKKEQPTPRFGGRDVFQDTGTIPFFWLIHRICRIGIRFCSGRGRERFSSFIK